MFPILGEHFDEVVYACGMGSVSCASREFFWFFVVFDLATSGGLPYFTQHDVGGGGLGRAPQRLASV